MTIKNALFCALAGVTLLAAPAQASELTKSDVEQIVRDYLVKNPEILVEMSNALRAKQEQQQAESDKALIKAHAKQLYDNNDPEMGNPKGSLTVVEFFDYNCGYCKRAHPLVKQLMAEDKDIRYIYKQFPILSETSYFAARAALAVQLGQPDKYQAFHEKLYAHKGPLADEAQVKQVAEAAGVNWSKVEAKLKDGSIDQNLSTNRALAEALAISGTPAFIIGDQILRGAPRDLASLKGFIKDVREGKSIQ
ncbi:outer membrane protein [Aeromonas enteropelogenes]|uniref:DsbA family protein n=1 Tax=Aeromonas enteropelogenes TaxID=29489 RepID=UPI0005A884CC|nr:DsbA family protein [Aeromonas enteropelogenes]UBH54598.1 DsbA family protein [Aeromonas enteropelogenes]BEE16140.1 outer membrane protein [Aeromonas enteropelogenes]BEE20299.1 outer membrane protein [Aeromonas enteropelogenes]